MAKAATKHGLESNAKAIKKILSNLGGVRDGLRPAGAFTTKEFAAHVGVSRKTALLRLSEFKDAGLLVNLGRVPTTSPLTEERTAVQMYRFIAK
jgi:hypothetical protein